MKSKPFVEEVVPAHSLRFLHRSLAASLKAPVEPALRVPIEIVERLRWIAELVEVILPSLKTAIDSLDLLFDYLVPLAPVCQFAPLVPHLLY